MKWIHPTLAISLFLAAACGEEHMPDGPEPVVTEADRRFYDPEVERFIESGLAGDLPSDATIVYTVLGTNEEGQEVEVEVELGFEAGPAPSELGQSSAAIEYTLNYCSGVGPSVSRSIWAKACNKNDATETADYWSGVKAAEYCAANVVGTGGDWACGSGRYTGGTCLADKSDRITHQCQVGSDTACGIFPFRHAKWKVTSETSGECGYNCRSSVFEP